MINFIFSLLILFSTPLLLHGAHESSTSQEETPSTSVTMRNPLPPDAPINQRDASGKTALQKAILTNNLEEVQKLLKNGADPNIPDASGSTPLFYAVTKNPTITQELLLYHADPNVHDREHHTPLSRAVGDFNFPVINLLLNAGADPNDSAGSGGVTPFQNIFFASNVPLVKLFLDKKADVTLHNDEQQNALILAAIYAQPEVLLLVLQRTHLKQADLDEAIVAVQEEVKETEDTLENAPANIVPNLTQHIEHLNTNLALLEDPKKETDAHEKLRKELLKEFSYADWQQQSIGRKKSHKLKKPTEKISPKKEEGKED